MKRKWLFFYKYDSFSFIIEANNYIEAYDKAFDAYGPQVEDMFYKEIKD